MYLLSLLHLFLLYLPAPMAVYFQLSGIPFLKQDRNCSVPSQLRCKIHLKSASLMGFCTIESYSYGLSSMCFDLY